MNSIPIKLVPETDSERMERIRQELDEEDRRIANDLFSGRHDARRLRSSAQALAMIADTPARQKIDPEVARRKADEALLGPINELLRAMPSAPAVALRAEPVPVSSASPLPSVSQGEQL